MTVQEFKEIFRNRVIVGLDGCRFTDDLGTMERLDVVKNVMSKDMIAFIDRLEKGGARDVSKFCVMQSLIDLEKNITDAYSLMLR